MSAQIEIRAIPTSRSVTHDVARDIAANHLHGNIIIVTAGAPLYAHAAFKKQWLQARRTIKREQARTFNPETLHGLDHKIARMDTLLFTTLASGSNTVYFTTASDLAQHPQGCAILYLTHPVRDDVLHKITACMSANSLVVRYLRPDLKSEYAAVKSHPWRNTM